MRARSMVMAAAVLLVAAGCGGESKPPVKAAENGDRINSVDVRFATDMVVHHAQAIQLVDLLREHTSSADLKGLGDRLLTEQAAQNETTVTWLTEWGEEIPETPLDHANAAHEDGVAGGMKLSGNEMPGLLSSAQVGRLESLHGAAFDEAWVELMTEQQKGAIAMAETVRQGGAFAPAKKLARTIAEQHDQTVDVLDGMG